jgi:hypothetical protein
VVTVGEGAPPRRTRKGRRRERIVELPCPLDRALAVMPAADQEKAIEFVRDLERRAFDDQDYEALVRVVRLTTPTLILEEV